MSGYVLGSDAEFDLDDIWEYIADSIDAAAWNLPHVPGQY